MDDCCSSALMAAVHRSPWRPAWSTSCMIWMSAGFADIGLIKSREIAVREVKEGLRVKWMAKPGRRGRQTYLSFEITPYSPRSGSSTSIDQVQIDLTSKRISLWISSIHIGHERRKTTHSTLPKRTLNQPIRLFNIFQFNLLTPPHPSMCLTQSNHTLQLPSRSCNPLFLCTRINPRFTHFDVC
jgi:hypothetical protein